MDMRNLDRIAGMLTLIFAAVVGASSADGVSLQTDAHLERMTARHVRVVVYDLVDQTDEHVELVHSREWLIGRIEMQTNITASVWAVEDQMSGSGVAFVRCAPLPHARVDPTAADFGSPKTAFRAGGSRSMTRVIRSCAFHTKAVPSDGRRRCRTGSVRYVPMCRDGTDCCSATPGETGTVTPASTRAFFWMR